MKWGAFMVKKRKRNAGFSLVELSIVVAVLAVLVGIIAPQWLKYVERSRRVTDVTDVTNARELRDTIERIAILDSDSTSVPELGWSYTSAVMWDKNTRMPSTVTNVIQAAQVEMGKVPVSETDEDLFWYVSYDPGTGSVEKICLCPRTASGTPNPSIQYELYPDPSDFLENGIN